MELQLPDKSNQALSVEDILEKQVERTREKLPFSLTVNVLAELMGFSHRKVYQLIADGKIPGARKIMGDWRVPRDVFWSWWYGGDQDDVN